MSQGTQTGSPSIINITKRLLALEHPTPCSGFRSAATSNFFSTLGFYQMGAIYEVREAP